MLVNDLHELSQAESHILHPGTRALYRHWEAIRAENAAPDKADLNLKRISDLLPNLVMIERDEMEQSYKWRLAGTQTCQLYKDEITGKDALAGWPSFERDTIAKLFDGVVTNLQPCLIRIRLTTTESQVIAAEMVGLPVRAQNNAKIHIFGGIFTFKELSSYNYCGIANLELSSARTIWTEPLPGDKLAASRGANGLKSGFKIINGGLH
jgi:hypothetical protein